MTFLETATECRPRPRPPLSSADMCEQNLNGCFVPNRCVQSNIVLLTQAFRKKFVIPDFMSFASHVDELYEQAKNLKGGQVRVQTDSGRGGLASIKHTAGVCDGGGGDDDGVLLFGRLLTTFPSCPGSAQTCGQCPSALWTDKGSYRHVSWLVFELSISSTQHRFPT